MRPCYTHFELSTNTDCHYFAIITTRFGHSYYVPGFRSRGAAYRYARRHPNQGR